MASVLYHKINNSLLQNTNVNIYINNEVSVTLGHHFSV